jgi:hypothetical protein
MCQPLLRSPPLRGEGWVRGCCRAENLRPDARFVAPTLTIALRLGGTGRRQGSLTFGRAPRFKPTHRR